LVLVEQVELMFHQFLLLVQTVLTLCFQLLHQLAAVVVALAVKVL
jgi:hypothetical protein